MSPCLGITTKRAISCCSPHQHATRESATGLGASRENHPELAPAGPLLSCPRGAGPSALSVFSRTPV